MAAQGTLLGYASLPGSAAATDPRVQKYVVVFRTTRSRSFNRTEFLDGQRRRAVKDVAALRRFVAEEGLSTDLVAVGDPSAFGMVPIIGTSRLAERLAAAPGVKMVVRD